jgi:hypothetical protein
VLAQVRHEHLAGSGRVSQPDRTLTSLRLQC